MLADGCFPEAEDTCGFCSLLQLQQSIPKSSTLIGLSTTTNHSAIGVPPFMETRILDHP